MSRSKTLVINFRKVPQIKGINYAIDFNSEYTIFDDPITNRRDNIFPMLNSVEKYPHFPWLLKYYNRGKVFENEIFLANFRKYIEQIDFEYISDLPIPIEIIREYRYKPWNLSKLKKNIDISVKDFPEFKFSIKDLNLEKNLFDNPTFLKNLNRYCGNIKKFQHYEDIPIGFIKKIII